MIFRGFLEEANPVFSVQVSYAYMAPHPSLRCLPVLIAFRLLVYNFVVFPVVGNDITI